MLALAFGMVAGAMLPLLAVEMDVSVSLFVLDVDTSLDGTARVLAKH